MKQANLHIVHIETGENLYGGALQVLYLIKGLRNHAPHIKNTLTCPKGSAIERQARGMGIPLRTVDFRGELDPRLFLSLIATVKATKKGGERPIIHCHSRRGADIWGPLAAIATSTPYIITRRVDNLETRLASWLKYSRAHRVVAISSAIAKILAAYGIRQEKIRTIPSAVDTTDFRPGCKERSWFEKEFSLIEKEKAIGMVAQFIPRKGHRYVIEAMPIILKETPNAVFLFFGKGPLKAQMEGLARRLGVYEACRFPGFRRDMSRIFPCLDLLVHPALMEGLGVAVLQAMACGVPVVATQSGGLQDLIRHKETAIALEGPDLKGELARQIPLILKEEAHDLRRRMVENSLSLIEKNFSIPSMASQYIRLYNETLKDQ